MAKKHACVTVLMRPARPAVFATASASTTKNRSLRSTIVCCASRGSLLHTSSGPYGLFSRKVAPGRASSSTSSFSMNSNWWQATKSALPIRYVDSIGSGPKRRCDTVIAPDFLLS